MPDIDGKPFAMKRMCKCGDHEVNQSDVAARVNGFLVVHGLLHCYQLRRAA